MHASCGVRRRHHADVMNGARRVDGQGTAAWWVRGRRRSRRASRHMPFVESVAACEGKCDACSVVSRRRNDGQFGAKNALRRRRLPELIHGQE
eukprot:810868-Pleurochrysis_carterae.AAC.1